ncbi:MAG TPA: hypothetical protein VHY37_13870 [Tepidisphaeraceae bacterium]|jgi:hypothetical protein|nr:hypothetical protein [Tepidisphaeraceae bacterium]
MTYEQQVDKWLRAVKKASKEVLSSKKKTLRFMQKAGIVDKTGKRLTKAYR